MDVIENEKDALCALQNVLFAITKRKTFLAIVSLYWIEEYFLVVMNMKKWKILQWEYENCVLILS